MFDFLKKNKLKIYGVVKGTFKKQEDINDPIFSKGLMGPTYAIVPNNSEILAPCDCKIVSVFPTKHAIGISCKNDIEIIIHVGIDTVKLNGEGITVFVSENQEVRKGDKLLSVDFDLIKEKGYICDVIVAITKSKKFELNQVREVDNDVVICCCE